MLLCCSSKNLSTTLSENLLYSKSHSIQGKKGISDFQRLISMERQRGLNEEIIMIALNNLIILDLIEDMASVAV